MSTLPERFSAAHETIRICNGISVRQRRILIHDSLVSIQIQLLANSQKESSLRLLQCYSRESTRSTPKTIISSGQSFAEIDCQRVGTFCAANPLDCASGRTTNSGGRMALSEDEKAGEDDEDSRQMVVELTFFLVG